MTAEQPLPAPDPVRRLTPKALATRARLVRVAGDVFMTDGYAAASVREIARRSGVSSGAIYGTFRGKAELLVAAVDAAIAADLETLPDDVRERSLPEIDAYQFATADAPSRARLRTLLLEAAVAARTDADVREHLGALLDRRVDRWTRLHDEWRAQQGKRAIDSRSFVELFIASDLGRGVLEALGAHVPDADEWATTMRTVFRTQPEAAEQLR